MKVKAHLLQTLVPFLVLPYWLGAQNGTKMESVQKKYYVGASFAPTRLHTFYPYSLDPPGAENIFYEAFSYRSGVELKIVLNQKFSLSANIHFRKINTKYDGTIFTDNFGVRKIDNSITADFQEKRFELPIRMDYRPVIKTVSPLFTMGIVSSLFYETESTFYFKNPGGNTTSSSSVNNYQNNNTGNFIGFIQFGTGIDIRKGLLNIQIFPMYEGGFLKNQTIGPKYIYTHTFSANIGLLLAI